MKIDDDFIKQWHPRYVEAYKTDDEPDYQQLLPVVAAEIGSNKTLEKETFTRILHWKSPRLKGIVRLSRYETDYAPAIRRSVEVTDDAVRLRVLTNLHGIATPTASTILHFIYPDRFPILDIRTVDILHMAGLIGDVRKTDTAYPAFRAAILGLQQQFPWWNLRQIDRALFAYHKVGLGRSASCV